MTEFSVEDWVALWQSELAAMAADRELRESWTGLLALWASTATAAMQFMPGRQADEQRRPPNGGAGATQPPGTPPVAAASDPGGDAARRLYERIAELESRLAALERGSGPQFGDD